MEDTTQNYSGISRIESLKVQGYRALRDLELKNITPLTVFLGQNGSGKSTIFDVFAFLSECFSVGLRKAWDKRGRFKEMRTRSYEGSIVIELKYREKPYPRSKKRADPSRWLITYHLAIEEDSKGPFIAEEWLQQNKIKFLNFKNGEGETRIISGELPGKNDKKTREKLDSREMLAVNSLGQFRKHPRISALRRFISSWYLSYLTIDSARSVPEAGAQEKLSAKGDNLANVIQYLKEQHPERLEEILDALSNRVPKLEKVDAELMQDGRLLLQIKDAPFEKPILSKFASDGTLKMLAYLTVLYDPDPPQLIGIEEPENHLYPRLLGELSEECRQATSRSQLMVTTHSPFFVDALKAEELRVIERNKNGYTEATCASDIPGIKEFMDAGATLGQLWMEGYFNNRQRS